VFDQGEQQVERARTDVHAPAAHPQVALRRPDLEPAEEKPFRHPHLARRTSTPQSRIPPVRADTRFRTIQPDSGGSSTTVLARGKDASPRQLCTQEDEVPRYLIQRSFPDGLSIPPTDYGRKSVAAVVANNAERGVTWIHSYVTPDRKQTFCIYDGPTAEAIRKVAERNGLPVGRITEVTVLDPYFYSA
jgi:hypothetical protein